MERRRSLAFQVAVEGLHPWTTPSAPPDDSAEPEADEPAEPEEEAVGEEAAAAEAADEADEADGAALEEVNFDDLCLSCASGLVHRAQSHTPPRD